MIPVEVECWSEFRKEWVDAGLEFSSTIEYIYWVSKWVREGQMVRVTLGESS